ncbi:MAG: methylated-DNA--[protein]-cysteine S-methyltransferase [Methylophilaceae bacterium]|nr:methylated-DNA--[protein]-cysteine S-methyltransferase [Methylophilaceae bacterium]
MVNTEFSAMVPAPFGAIGIITRDDFLLHLKLLSHEMLAEVFTEKPTKDAFTLNIINQIKTYLANSRVALNSPYALQGTPFQKCVWKAIANIPSGQVFNYTQLADKVASGPRAVANACGANNIPLFIPCHRVVAKNGLGGFMQGEAGGLTIKQWLLAHESVAL